MSSHSPRPPHTPAILRSALERCRRFGEGDGDGRPGASGTRIHMTRYASIPTPPKKNETTNARRNSTGSRSKYSPRPVQTPAIFFDSAMRWSFFTRSAQRPHVDLAEEGVAAALHRLGPACVVDLRPLRRGPRLAVPADLLHVVVELEGEAVRVDGESAVVDAGEELGRQVFDRHAVLLEERDRVLQLPVAAEPEPERHQ